MNDITALAQQLRATAEKANEHGEFNMAMHTVEVLALVEALEKAQAITAAAEKLVRCKGRYHSEQNYRALAALFGVKTPDLPPLESESRTVTVKLPAEYLNADGSVNADMANTCPVVSAYREAHRAAGIQVIEGEA
ncbi:Uncharacterised protein [Kluyvera intermedia]|nr:Uncharacterised protein [Kluyvera intermedia]